VTCMVAALPLLLGLFADMHMSVPKNVYILMLIMQRAIETVILFCCDLLE
jgi:hypothetical protein